MKSIFQSSHAILAVAAVLLTVTVAEARPRYGVSGNRGYAVGGPRGGAIVGDDRAVVRTPRGVAATGPNGTAVARRPLPRGYIHTVPTGYRRVAYGGYNCYFVGGIYYRPVIYQGSTVYVVVK
jgi:hypothetical protein